MADTVDTITMLETRSSHVIRLTNDCDGTGESTVTKLDRSTLTDNRGNEPKALDIVEIQWSINGFNFIKLLWDASTDDEIAILSGNGFRDYRPYGGLKDPISGTNVGDILVTTDGEVDGAHYDILIVCALRQSLG